MDVLLTLLSVAGVTYVMGIPGSDDIMLNYQTTSFHDALYVRKVLGLKPAPEFEAWLTGVGLWESGPVLRLPNELPNTFQRSLTQFG
jgi:ethanolamine ammonia-lyase large subunit